MSYMLITLSMESPDASSKPFGGPKTNQESQTWYARVELHEFSSRSLGGHCTRL